MNDDSDDVVMIVVWVTPSMAREWLERNPKTKQRTMNEPRIRRYELAMASEEGWFLTHEGLAFGVDGELLDGQHRLHAIIRYGHPVRMRVFRGVVDRTRVVMDTGRGRSAIDVAEVMGVSRNGRAVGIASVLARQVFKLPGSSVEPRLALLMLERHGKAIAWLSDLVPGTKKVAGLPVHMFVPVVRAWYTRDRSRLAEFVQMQLDGEARSPVDKGAILLRDLLRSGRLYREEVYQKTESALKKFLDRVRVDKLFAVRDEQFLLPEEE